MSQGLSSKISSPTMTLTKGSQETRSAIDVRHFVSEYRAKYGSQIVAKFNNKNSHQNQQFDT